MRNFYKKFWAEILQQLRLINVTPFNGNTFRSPQMQLVTPQLSQQWPERNTHNALLQCSHSTVTESAVSRCPSKILTRLDVSRAQFFCQFENTTMRQNSTAAATRDRVFSAESLCAAQKTQCNPERSTCSDGSGTARCQCFQGYYKHNLDDQSCLGGCSCAPGHAGCNPVYRFTQASRCADDQ